MDGSPDRTDCRVEPLARDNKCGPHSGAEKER